MELKIFKPGFTEAEFNEFLGEHITIKMNFLSDGTIYILWKGLNALGNDRIDFIDRLDTIVKQAEIESLTASMDKENYGAELADYKQAINKFGPNQKEYKTLEDKIKGAEMAMLMADETIDKRNRQIVGAKLKSQEILNKKK